MDELKQQLLREIHASGPISFARFMEVALYSPSLGYYEQSELPRFGVQGDFATAPELGPLFASAFARQIDDVLRAIPGAAVVEVGAGSGQFAVDALTALRALGQTPQYVISERSVTLQKAQRERLNAHGFDATWLHEDDSLPDKVVLIGNEVIDALPAERVVYRAGDWWLSCVTEHDGHLAWTELPASSKITSALQSVETTSLADGYVTEVRPQLSTWLAGLTRTVAEGVMFFIDYGYPRREYFHPQRVDGTAIAHRQHRAVDDLLASPGNQDLTVFVDFTALAEAADATALDVLGYVGQGSFLLSCDVLKDLDNQPDTRRDAAAELRRLTLPGEMGERFKVMALGRGYELPLRGFSLTNQTHLL